MTADPAGRPQRAGGAPWWVVAVAVTAAVVALALAAALLVSGGGGDDREQDRRSALDAARERTVALTSYDHRRLDADFARVLESATGPFEQEYTATTGQLRPAFLEQEAVATGEVVAAGLESASGDRAVAVVAVDQVIRTKGASPRTERNRLRMTLVRRDGTWLVEQVQRL